MSAHEWFIEHRTAFVTRSLEAGDEQSFADHLARCAECQAATAEIQRELGWLGMGVAPVTPPPGFQWKAANHALSRRRPVSQWLRALPLLAAAAAIFFAVSLVRERRERDAQTVQIAQLSRDLSAARETFAALNDTVAVLRGAATVLQTAIAMNNHKGGLIIFADESTHRWNVVMHGLPPAPAGQKYQFWFICSDGMLRAAELRPATQGSETVMVTLGMPSISGSVVGAALSVEQVSNSSNVPRGKELAHIML
jgi:Anti-sigma-K factor rskA